MCACVLAVTTCVLLCTVDGVSSSGAPTPGADTTVDSRERANTDPMNRSGTESETK